MNSQANTGGMDAGIEDVADEGYRRELTSRQVQMMAIGSAIGVGLFYGSGAAIVAAGPAIIATFVVAGFIAFLVTRALGELVVYRPTSGSVMDYTKEFLSPFAGFATGWSYWVAAVTVCTAEVIASGHYIAYWFPGVPVWLTAALALAILLIANLLSVKIFGELEYWFASIKVTAILALIVIGVGVLMFDFSSLGDTASVDNLWQHGGFAPHGAGPIVFTLTAAFFAYSGIELAAGTAGEVVDPRKTLRSAINLLPIRISVFYVGSLVVVLTLMPWTSYSEGHSPFVQVFEGIGLPAAAGVMNFVVLTAALSGCNVNIYMASRLVRRMSIQGEASAWTWLTWPSCAAISCTMMLTSVASSGPARRTVTVEAEGMGEAFIRRAPVGWTGVMRGSSGCTGRKAAVVTEAPLEAIDARNRCGLTRLLRGPRHSQRSRPRSRYRRGQWDGVQSP